jgi:Amt family ammonium transporter
LTQLLGVACYGVFTVTCAAGLFYAIKATMGLRVSAEEELEGLDYSEHGMHAYDVVPAGSGLPQPLGAPGAEASFAHTAALTSE